MENWCINNVYYGFMKTFVTSKIENFDFEKLTFMKFNFLDFCKSDFWDKQCLVYCIWPNLAF